MQQRILPGFDFDANRGSSPLDDAKSDRNVAARVELNRRDRVRFGESILVAAPEKRNAFGVTLLISATRHPPARPLACPLQHISTAARKARPAYQFGTGVTSAPWERRVKLAASQQLYAYWSELRGARGAPERNDIDPGAIRGVLADTFILEFDPRARFPLRISGSRTTALFLRELRGAPFLELWRQDDRAEITEILMSVANEAQPFLLGASGGPSGMAAIDLEVLLLPLRHHGATHARILGSCAPRLAPEWLGLLAIDTLALASLRALGRSPGGDAFPSRAPALGADFRRRGHLFVYSSRG